MSGLVYKDLLVFIRKTHKFTWIMEVVFFLFFIFAIKNSISVFTFCLLVVPVSSSGLATTLKDIDINCNSARFNLTLPFSHRELVLSRFLSSFSVHIGYALEMLLFCAVRYFVYGDFPLGTYLTICGAGMLAGLCMTSLNLLTSFTASLNTNAILYLVIIVIAFAIYMVFLFTGMDITKFLQMGTPMLLAIAAFITVLLIIVSYTVSVKIYVKKLG